MSILRLLEAVRADENTVGVAYYHNEKKLFFIVVWSNVYTEKGVSKPLGSYSLQNECSSRCAEFDTMIKNTIEAKDCSLYLELANTKSELLN